MKRLFGPLAGVTLALLFGAGVSTAAQPEAAPDASRPDQQASANIVDTAAAAGSFKTLLAAVDAAGLTSTLAGPGPFTVFAPTDTAFAALPAGTVDALLKDIPRLREVLLYHVVQGQVLAADVTKLTSATTVQGSALPVVTSGTSVTVGGANVVTADVLASNGVIHVIDRVLLPPAAGATPTAPHTGGAGLVSDSGVTGLWIAALAFAALALPVVARRALATERS